MHKYALGKLSILEGVYLALHVIYLVVNYLHIFAVGISQILKKLFWYS